MSLLQWKHTTAALQKTLAPTGTHWNALLTLSPSSNRLQLFQKTLSKEKQKAHKPRLQGNMGIFLHKVGEIYEKMKY